MGNLNVATTQIELTDIAGHLVQQIRPVSNEVNLQIDAAPGIYFLSIKSTTLNSIQKIIKY